MWSSVRCDAFRGAKALASYEEDFYAGMPAASKNTYGKGTTYYIATQFEEEGLAKILDQAVQEAGVSSVIPEETGLEVVTRVSDTTRFYFVMNFTDEEQILPESLTGKKDMISQKMTEHGMKLKKMGCPFTGRTSVNKDSAGIRESGSGAVFIPV